MSKKKKTAAASRLTARKTEAPMLVSRPDSAPPTAVVSSTIAIVAPAIRNEPSAPAPVATSTAIAIDRTQIARLAFAKFASRGYVHGYHVADWLEAEAELRTAHR